MVRVFACKYYLYDYEYTVIRDCEEGYYFIASFNDYEEALALANKYKHMMVVKSKDVDALTAG